MPARDRYTDPELRDKVKEAIQEGDKGGAPGQWSARKAQMMASEYKKQGGGYTTNKDDKSESQKHLDQWTEEDWQTEDGSGSAKKEDGTEKRYLPKKAWEQMSEKEKEATDQKKQAESKEGKQYSANTSKAKEARKAAQQDGEQQQNGDSTIDKKDATACTQHWEDEEHSKRGQEEYRKFKAAQKSPENSSPAQNEEPGEDKVKKRGRGANYNGSNKKQKNSGSSDQPKGPAGDKTRVPTKGQKVQWHALPGYVEGTVVEVVYEEKKVDGKTVKGSKEDPRIVLKSNSSGKIAVHKPEVVYFD